MDRGISVLEVKLIQWTLYSSIRHGKLKIVQVFELYMRESLRRNSTSNLFELRRGLCNRKSSYKRVYKVYNLETLDS